MFTPKEIEIGFYFGILAGIVFLIFKKRRIVLMKNKVTALIALMVFIDPLRGLALPALLFKFSTRSLSSFTNYIVIMSNFLWVFSGGFRSFELFAIPFCFIQIQNRVLVWFLMLTQSIFAYSVFSRGIPLANAAFLIMSLASGLVALLGSQGNHKRLLALFKSFIFLVFLLIPVFIFLIYFSLGLNIDASIFERWFLAQDTLANACLYYIFGNGLFCFQGNLAIDIAMEVGRNLETMEFVSSTHNFFIDIIKFYGLLPGLLCLVFTLSVIKDLPTSTVAAFAVIFSLKGLGIFNILMFFFLLLSIYQARR